MTSKAQLRSRVRQSRAQRSSQHAAEFSRQLLAVVREYDARSVCCFVGTATEPDTAEFLARAHAAGLRVWLPRSLAGGELEWVAHTGTLAPGRFGIQEPVGAGVPSSALTDVDLCFAPAAAVDTRGTRLGWGRGFYDRALAAMRPTPPVFAVVFADEVFEAVPAETHDISVLGAITEKAVHHFG